MQDLNDLYVDPKSTNKAAEEAQNSQKPVKQQELSFEEQMALDKKKREESAALEKKKQAGIKKDAEMILKTVNGYATPSGITKIPSYLIYRIVNLVKAIVGRSDWQVTQKTLARYFSDKIHTFKATEWNKIALYDEKDIEEEERVEQKEKNSAKGKKEEKPELPSAKKISQFSSGCLKGMVKEQSLINKAPPIFHHAFVTIFQPENARKKHHEGLQIFYTNPLRIFNDIVADEDNFSDMKYPKGQVFISQESLEAYLKVFLKIFAKPKPYCPEPAPQNTQQQNFDEDRAQHGGRQVGPGPIERPSVREDSEEDEYDEPSSRCTYPTQVRTTREEQGDLKGKREAVLL